MTSEGLDDELPRETIPHLDGLIITDDPHRILNSLTS